MYGLAGRLANYFIDSKLTPVLVLVSLALGLFAVITTPKEEEPQIVVPMIDIFISYPGATPEEVERRVVTPLEKKLWELKDIEYIYSASSEGGAVVTARFYVGTDPVKALVDLNTKMMSAMDLAPPGVMLPPLIKPKSIDDVPILTLTLWGKPYDWYSLRRIASTVENEIKKINNVADVFLVGGRSREIRVILDPAKMAAYRISPLYVAQVIKSANAQEVSGNLTQSNKVYQIRTGEFLKSKEDVENILISVVDGKPVYLRDVATVVDGPSEIKDYVLMGFGPKAEEKGIQGVKEGELYPAVTIAVSKRKGTNAVNVAQEVLKLVDHLKGNVIPKDVNITVTRNYGETAKEKADELLEHLFIATFSVILLIAVALGIREAAVVGVAVPITLAIALFLSEMYGFTLNRVTLFALIFAIGILVDDAIVVVENIHRWFELKLAKTPREAIVRATDEVGNPTVLATFTVIAALMPMAFVSGLMGPYMRPIPINASVAMFFSLLVAFIVTPWASYKFLKHEENHKKQEIDIKSTTFWKVYSKIMLPLIVSKPKRYAFYGFVLLLMGLSLSLFITKTVVVKMLPYDNKSELQIVLDMPEGTPIERTLEVAKAIGDYVSRQSIVTDYQIYVGTASPFNFNGLVRHYYLRQSSNMADIQINLINKHERIEQSHDFAKKIRPMVHKIAQQYGAKYVAVVEVPPGPPVLSPIVAEVYGPDLKEQERFAKEVLRVFEETPSITDAGIYLEKPAPMIRLVAKEDKLKLSGISKEELVLTLRALIGGYQVGLLQSTDTEHVPIVIRFDEKYRTLELLKNLKIPNREGKLIPLTELVEIKEDTRPVTIYHKNLRRVIYVIGDVAGREEAPFYGILDVRKKVLSLPNPYGSVKELWMSLPLIEDSIYVKWDGEMHITLEVFRDLGLAFGVALFAMYVLILGWFKDFKIPGVIMAPIPLTLVGIVPGHLLLGAFFTATSMIGFIALAGIIVRNSILLVDFAEERIKDGVPPHLAVVEAGVIRTRPILLTAVAVIVGAFVILFDPIFNGLAISLIFGTIGSTTLTLVLIPIMYYASKVKKLAVVPSPEEVQKDILR
ncbi:acriflavin resistance protein [Hydrogenobacter thermophilus TK-6]|uniref:Acriflavin resistance protein n=1 Tax=Hydrogenobacter thermophilus (strain DSM 6534 / IAM 12695 / TK-6) TaxID=608538 RepID=D3DK19_HYDTT|nr:efflux RND transporter permease subunit [Hydrogenobacter thermophilus]ADO46091.1 acriflavin resistance protein [Hydrogenobacter thermophilus TK-6]BAI70171.1 acriflavin resistance protein [Hydrogenobacter thermophilus TK-6]